jgi:hypothetical protein
VGLSVVLECAHQAWCPMFGSGDVSPGTQSSNFNSCGGREQDQVWPLPRSLREAMRGMRKFN